MTDREKIAVALNALAVVLEKPVNELRLTGYYSLLAGSETELVLLAIKQLGKELKWFPKPVEILDKVKSLARDRALARPQLEEPPPTDAEKAKVMEYLGEWKKGKGTAWKW
ncbi:MAG: hypothetical protein KOO63_02700 [Bacteroidales bacterium]|nr:hypothetical protein [Candidatus Latescibacterota bacterium]